VPGAPYLYFVPVIKRPTVLVLGAGASMHLGFPSGRGLVTNVVKGLHKETEQLFQILVACGFDPVHIALFRDALARSGRSSVDVFLEHRSEFLPLGRTAIAAVLTPVEIEENLFTPDGDWYEYLFRYLGPSRSDVEQGRLSVVTFNYDRSFEQYLFTAFRNAFNLSTTDAIHLLERSVPVVHVYGKLGDLPYASGVGAKGVRTYQALDPGSRVGAALEVRDGIKIMHEGATDNPALERAQQLIQDADVICFLGFGYLAENLQRLRLDLRRDGAQVWGSAHGVGGGELTPILNFFARHRAKQPITLGAPDQEVLEFLKQHPVFV